MERRSKPSRASRQAVLEWYKGLKDSNNVSFMPLFWDESRYLVLCGGGGSGKSIFAGRKVLERVTSEPGHRWLVVRKVARTLRDSCFAQLVGQMSDKAGREIYPGSGMRVNRSDLRISFANGSEILFAGLDDVEKLKSIYDITGIWAEEASEMDEGDFSQLDIRLRTDFPYYLQMILSFNPVSITHWLKKRFFDKPDPRATTHRSTYKDNRFLTAEAIQTLEAFKDTDPYYYQVYCLGQWGVTGKTVFDGQAVSDRLAALTEPIRRGLYDVTVAEDGVHIASWRFVEDAGGPIFIYREPEEGRPYVLSGDTAGEGSDWFSGHVLDNITGRQVAVLHCQYDEDIYARQMYCLGMEYHEALIGIEANFSTYPIKLLGLMGYRRQYVRELEDDYTGDIKEAFGFRTTSITRPVILAGLIQAMREGIHTVNDEATLLEMLTFVRNDKMRMEAEPGAHDDLIMGLAIAWYIRSQQRMTVLRKDDTPLTKWTADMLADYNAASSEERAYLIKKWGKPGSGGRE